MVSASAESEIIVIMYISMRFIQNATEIVVLNLKCTADRYNKQIDWRVNKTMVWIMKYRNSIA